MGGQGVNMGGQTLRRYPCNVCGESIREAGSQYGRLCGGSVRVAGSQYGRPGVNTGGQLTMISSGAFPMPLSLQG